MPTQFGRFRVERLLGRGAMGAVYFAWDTQLDRAVALKVPRLTGAEDSEIVQRLLREAKAAASLDHPHICRVYDVGNEAGTAFIAMQFIEGRPLSDYIAPGHFQSERRSVDVARKLASALVEAHAKGIIHRDLKPANILVNERGEPILMDFGLARRADSARDGRATQAGMLIGSPAFMSPEQANGETDKIGPCSDLYSLGVLLFELLTNQLPFQGSVLTILSQ
ncbi:MAG TPA: serine/threonine-protein kinase, partial [Planctomycetaceae bacterium]|nr:serine/threonine-protein kinase [Planctomycetaceae bacterium]